jgi:hypothetical protein
MVRRNVPKRIGLEYKFPVLLKVCQNLVQYIVFFKLNFCLEQIISVSLYEREREREKGRSIEGDGSSVFRKIQPQNIVIFSLVTKQVLDISTLAHYTICSEIIIWKRETVQITVTLVIWWSLGSFASCTWNDDNKIAGCYSHEVECCCWRHFKSDNDGLQSLFLVLPRHQNLWLYRSMYTFFFCLERCEGNDNLLYSSLCSVTCLMATIQLSIIKILFHTIEDNVIPLRLQVFWDATSVLA